MCFSVDKVSRGSEETSMYKHIGGLLRYSYVVNALKKNKDKHGVFLDIGCGQGAYTIEACKLFSRSIGIDISPDNIDFCKKTVKRWRLRKALFLVEDANNIPFSDVSFFVVLISEVLEHLSPSKINHVLTETRRVLMPNGVLLITIPSIFLDYKVNRESLFKDALFSFKEVIPNKNSILKRRSEKKGAFHNFFTKKEIENILCRSGFRVLKSCYIVKWPIVASFTPAPIRKIKSLFSNSFGDPVADFKESYRILCLPDLTGISKIHRFFELLPFFGNHIFISAIRK